MSEVNSDWENKVTSYEIFSSMMSALKQDSQNPYSEPVEEKKKVVVEPPKKLTTSRQIAHLRAVEKKQSSKFKERFFSNLGRTERTA